MSILYHVRAVKQTVMQTNAPVDRSIPPVMMIINIPIAFIA